MRIKKTLLLLSILTVFVLLFTQCAPETVIVTETVVVKETVEVEKEVEKTVVVEKEVEKTVIVEKEVEVKEIVELVGAIPYPEGVPMLGSEGGVQRYTLDEVMDYKALDEYDQPDWMDAFVANGTLPPVEERLPENPQVVLSAGMSSGAGEYGGTWRDFSACPSEGWNLGAGQTQGWFGINIIYEEALLLSAPLFRYDKVEPWPNLATDWEWSDDGMELTMNLIQGAKWSDGEAFDADDVMFTWEYIILDPNVNSSTSRTSWQIGGEDVELEKVDDYTIKWTFPTAFPVQMLFLMDEYDFAVYPEHVWAQYHPEFSDNDYEQFEKAWPMERLPPVTMGPWVATEYKTDELLVMRRNPYYWKVDENGKQLPYLDEVSFQKGPSGVGRTLSTMAGSADHSNLENPNVFIETLKRQAEPDAHFNVVWGPELLAFGLQMNLSESLGVEDDRDAELRKLFRDQRFRRAVSQAIDRDGVAQAVVRGPFLRPFPGGLLPGATEYDRKSVVYYPYSPETSRKLLTEIGLEDTDGDGIVNWTEGPMAGENLVIELNAGEDAEATGNIAEALVPLMADVGISVNFRPMKGTAMSDDNLAGTWEWHMWRSGQNLAVPYSRIEELGPTTKEWGIHREGDEPRNLLPFEEDLVRIINEFAAERDDAKRKELMFEFNQIWTENVYRVGIVVGRYGLALAKRFQNVPIGCPTFLYHWTWGNASPEQVWVQPEEQIDEIQPGVIPTYASDYLNQ